MDIGQSKILGGETFPDEGRMEIFPFITMGDFCLRNDADQIFEQVEDVDFLGDWLILAFVVQDHVDQSVVLLKILVWLWNFWVLVFQFVAWTHGGYYLVDARC